MAAQYQTGRLASTPAVHLLIADQVKGANETYAIHTPVSRVMRRAGAKVKPIKGYRTEMLFETRPSWNAGARDNGEWLPGEDKLTGGIAVRQDQGRLPVDVFLSRFYAGIRIDGPVAEAARTGQSFAPMVARDFADAVDMIALQEEISLRGDGTQALAEVASVSGSTITYRVASGTVALAGQMGGHFLELLLGSTFTVIDRNTGVARTDGGAGLQAVDLDRSTNTLTCNRSVAGMGIQAGDPIVEGDDRSNSFNRGFPGVDAWCGNESNALSLYGQDRATNPWLNSFVLDAQSGGALGEFNSDVVGRCMQSASFSNKGRVSMVLSHPGMHREAIFGAGIENFAPGATRQNPGMASDRRFMGMGELGGGATHVSIQMPGFGTCDLVGAWGVRPNTLYLLDPSTFTICEAKGGLKFLDGYGGENDVFIRRVGYDQWDAVIRREVTAFCTAPNKNARVNNMLQPTPDF